MLSPGRASAWGEAGFTRYGGTIITSSVWLFRKSLDENSSPIIGRFCSHGRPDAARFVFSCTRPAITNEPPEGSSTEVSAFRIEMPGMVTVLVVEIGNETAPDAERSLTSVATRI